MNLLVTLILAIAATIAAGAVAGRLIDAGMAPLKPLRRSIWGLATTLALILAVYAAHAMGIFSVPLVAVAFVCVAIPARAYLGSTRRNRERRERGAAASGARSAAGAAAFLARHELVVLTVLACAVVVVAGAIAVFVGPH